VASTRPIAPAGRSGRLTLLTVTIAGAAMLIWLIASLAIAAFG
jgi:hypothetical protein